MNVFDSEAKTYPFTTKHMICLKIHYKNNNVLVYNKSYSKT